MIETKTLCKVDQARALSRSADWIIQKHPLCRHITSKQITQMIEQKLVSAKQVAQAGLHP